MRNYQALIAATSIGAILCLVVGWFGLFSPDINYLISKRVFYVLVGASFIIQAQVLVDRRFYYPLIVAGILCIVGAFLPLDSEIAVIKTVGLLGGVIISMFSRNRVSKD